MGWDLLAVDHFGSTPILPLPWCFGNVPHTRGVMPTGGAVPLSITATLWASQSADQATTSAIFFSSPLYLSLAMVFATGFAIGLCTRKVFGFFKATVRDAW